MYFTDATNEPMPLEISGKFLSAEEVGAMIRLMQELRDVTQSRRTFASAAEFLARFSGEASSRVVRADVLET